jgi:hypothetical protein
MEERTYTQAELLKAIEYACGYQKASSYQDIGQILLSEGYDTTPQDVQILDNLSDCDNNNHEEITLEDIHEYLDETGMYSQEFSDMCDRIADDSEEDDPKERNKC